MTTIDPTSPADLPRDDTGRITSDYEPTALEVEVCRQAICREFGSNGTDGYYIRILKAVHAAAPPAPQKQTVGGSTLPPTAFGDVRSAHVPPNSSVMGEKAPAFTSGISGGSPKTLSPGEDGEQFVKEAIRSAYDRGYNDARIPLNLPRDNAPGYRGTEMSEEIATDVLSQLRRLPSPAPRWLLSDGVISSHPDVDAFRGLVAEIRAVSSALAEHRRLLPILEYFLSLLDSEIQAAQRTPAADVPTHRRSIISK